MTSKIQITSINILNSKYRILFTILIYFIIYLCYYSNNFALCMITNTTRESLPEIAEPKNSLIREFEGQRNALINTIQNQWDHPEYNRPSLAAALNEQVATKNIVLAELKKTDIAPKMAQALLDDAKAQQKTRDEIWNFITASFSPIIDIEIDKKISPLNQALDIANQQRDDWQQKYEALAESKTKAQPTLRTNTSRINSVQTKIQEMEDSINFYKKSRDDYKDAYKRLLQRHRALELSLAPKISQEIESLVKEEININKVPTSFTKIL